MDQTRPSSLPPPGTPLTSQYPQPNTWAEVSVVGGRSRSWGGGGEGGQTLAPDSACPGREGGIQASGLPRASPAPRSAQQPQPTACVWSSGLQPSSQTPRKLPGQQPITQKFPLSLACHYTEPLPGCDYCRSAVSPGLSSFSTPSPTAPLCPWWDVFRTHRPAPCRLSHLCAPPLLPPCSSPLLHPLHTLPSFHGPGQSHLLQEGLPEHSRSW